MTVFTMVSTCVLSVTVFTVVSTCVLSVTFFTVVRTGVLSEFFHSGKYRCFICECDCFSQW